MRAKERRKQERKNERSGGNEEERRGGNRRLFQICLLVTSCLLVANLETKMATAEIQDGGGGFKTFTNQQVTSP